MNSLLAFALGTVLLAWVSWPSLRNPRSHGFYRFMAWVCMWALVLVNLPVWQVDPYGPHQLASWVLQLISLALVVQAVFMLLRVGRPIAERGGAELFAFERTSTLVTSGVYRYIRHPMYAALLYLAWAVFLKDVSWGGLVLVGGVTAFLYLTATREEDECLQYFGADYGAYMKTNKRFVPFVF